ncbi:MAG: N-acetylmuramoyl-L-alanine amidase [Rivularia sp. ALOHA_DT_140]|nr:N-acetylmuramoyl-L-alanine amidase [Rivularia sp. ALOHA_DT_140]
MYFGIDIGHNCPPDTGAVSGRHREDVYTKQVGELVIKQLKQRGHRAVSVTPRRAFGARTRDRIMNSLRQRARNANRLRVDYFVSIHFNAAANRRASGSEVFVYNYHSSARTLAQEVLNRIIALGFRNRKVKTGNFAVLKYTNMPAILVECCFLTSTEDMNRFNVENMATAIVNGLIGDPGKPDESIPGILRINVNTYAKPSTDQSSSISRGELYTIKIGEYNANLLGDEEGHYLVELDEPIGERKVHYIYAQHADFLDKVVAGVLKVTVSTYAKPSSDQSSSINPQELYNLETGEYKGKLLAEEKGHYLVELDQEIGGRKVHYVFDQYAEFIPE